MDNNGLLVISILGVIFVTPYIYMHISAARAVGKSVPVNKLADRTGAKLTQTLYCYFMSKSCSNCKSMTPAIESLQQENPNIILIDIKQQPELAKDFHVYGTPTLMAVDDGMIVKVKLGGLNLKKIDQFMNT